MADRFASIAAGEIGSREPLVQPKPIADNGKRFPLADSAGASGKVYKKITEKAELDALIGSLREKYAPFMKKCSPAVETERKLKELSEFDFRMATADDRRDFSSVVSSGEWEKVSLPHYGGPVGYAISYYKTTFTASLPEDRSLFLRFKCSDYITEVYINGTLAGTHEGFFSPFEFDISELVRDGENTLLVTVKNDFKYGGDSPRSADYVHCEGDKLYAATGLGYDDPAEGWHHCPAGMGLCGRVFLEERPRTFVSDIFVRPMPKTSEIEIWTTVYRCDYPGEDDISLSYSVYGENFADKVIENKMYRPQTFHHADFGDVMTEADIGGQTGEDHPVVFPKFYHGDNTVKFRIKLPNFRFWTPETPYLYSAQVSLYIKGIKVDADERTFGMRTFEIDEAGSPKGMFYLNGGSIRLRGANTMGFEQQDVFKGDYEQLLYDMLMAKACNMNFLRITQRPVYEEIYSLCDRIGLMLQTDLPLFSVVRRTKFAEVIRQCEEMEKLIRSHPSCILVSYMNEPMANGNDNPFRHVVRSEQDMIFRACDDAVHMLNPDRAIKHIDGDYDPPDEGFPDNHCYCTWYNGHGIDMGSLYRGNWLGIKDGWYCGCGEFGAEGLDPVSLMRSRYPKEWLPQSDEEEKSWSPSEIVGAQTGNMHYFFYDTQNSLENWVSESRRWQERATRLQTGAFRRNPLMTSFAIHLFIDAWPSGWMKTIVDCERNPKPAFYAYMDELTPLAVSLRTDRKTFFSGEKAEIEIFICNDTHKSSDGHTIDIELIRPDGELVKKATVPALFGENDVFLQGKATFDAPTARERGKYVLRAVLRNGGGKAVHYTDEALEIFPPEKVKNGSAVTIDGSEGLESKAGDVLSALSEGKTVIIESLPAGEYKLGDVSFRVKNCGMRPLHFVSRSTSHPLVRGFEKDDFSFWYDEKADMMTPLVRTTFTGDGFTPIITSGNTLSGSAWGKPLFPALVCGEINVGEGKLIISTLDFGNHLKNPVAVIFSNRLKNY